MDPNENSDKKKNPKDRRGDRKVITAKRTGRQPDEQPAEATTSQPPRPEQPVKQNRKYPIITTSKGKVKGILCSDADVKDESSSKDYVSFFKIPIAQTTRFKNAGKLSTWPGIMDCRHISNRKLKIVEMANAYVNVFTKNLPEGDQLEKNKRKDPVMVFVPGEYATNDDFEISFGPQFLLREDVVVVVVGYRTGILGKLICPDSPRGIQGVTDLLECMRWVRDEIHQFGGHPENITYFGQGDGAAALWTISTINYDELERQAELRDPDRNQMPNRCELVEKQLYHKLILQSSTAMCRQWVTKLNAKEFAYLTRLTGDNPLELLRVSHFDVLRNFEKKLPKKPLYRMIDYGEMTYLQPNMFRYKVPVLIGFNSNEYHYDKSIYDDIDKNKDSILDTLGHHYLRDDFDYDDEVVKFYAKIDRDLVAKVESQFYDDQPATQEKFEQVTQDLHHNISVLCQVKELALGMAPKKVYLYKFNGNTHLNMYKSQQLGQTDVPGASFGDELGYLFKMHKMHKTQAIEAGSKEEILRDRMVAMWTNFARYGCPVTSNEDGNKMFGMKARWKGVKTKPFEDKSNVRTCVLASMYGTEIADELVYKELPEVDRMKKWWNILVDGDSWLEI